jgi:hypothetical protein
LPRGAFLQIQHRRDSHSLQSRCDAWADTPDFAHLNLVEEMIKGSGIEPGEVAHGAIFRPLLGHVIGKLGKRLGRSHSNADWQSNMALNGFSESLAVGGEPPMLKSREIQKAFVDRIHLLVR